MTPDLFISYVMVLVKSFAGENCGGGGGYKENKVWISPDPRQLSGIVKVTEGETRRVAFDSRLQL